MANIESPVITIPLFLHVIQTNKHMLVRVNTTSLPTWSPSHAPPDWHAHKNPDCDEWQSRDAGKCRRIRLRTNAKLRPQPVTTANKLTGATARTSITNRRVGRRDRPNSRHGRYPRDLPKPGALATARSRAHLMPTAHRARCARAGSTAAGVRPVYFVDGSSKLAGRRCIDWPLRVDDVRLGVDDVEPVHAAHTDRLRDRGEAFLSATC